MKILLISWALILAFQEPTLPKGWFCQHNVKDTSHNCACHRECDKDGNLGKDRECKSWCQEDHCHCPSYNCP